MNNSEYMVKKMIEHEGEWTVEKNDKEELVIVNQNGRIRGVENSNGTIIFVEELLSMYQTQKEMES